MTMRRLLLAGLMTATALSIAIDAHATSATELLQRAERGYFPNKIERGDGMMLWLTARNRYCGRSKADGEYRARRLLRYAERLGKHRTYANASALYNEIYKSKMYTKCWRTIETNEIKVGFTISF